MTARALGSSSRGFLRPNAQVGAAEQVMSGLEDDRMQFQFHSIRCRADGGRGGVQLGRRGRGQPPLPAELRAGRRPRIVDLWWSAVPLRGPLLRADRIPRSPGALPGHLTVHPPCPTFRSLGLSLRGRTASWTGRSRARVGPGRPRAYQCALTALWATSLGARVPRAASLPTGPCGMRRSSRHRRNLRCTGPSCPSWRRRTCRWGRGR